VHPHAPSSGLGAAKANGGIGATMGENEGVDDPSERRVSIMGERRRCGRMGAVVGRLENERDGMVVGHETGSHSIWGETLNVPLGKTGMCGDSILKESVLKMNRCVKPRIPP